jgi:hypothetical protein
VIQGREDSSKISNESLGTNKMREISWLAKLLLASQEGLCSME